MRARPKIEDYRETTNWYDRINYRKLNEDWVKWAEEAEQGIKELKEDIDFLCTYCVPTFPNFDDFDDQYQQHFDAVIKRWHEQGEYKHASFGQHNPNYKKDYDNQTNR